MFNGYDGIYGGQWKGPVFVLTHRAPDAHHHPAINFVGIDLKDAVATAKDAARGKAVVVFGANVATQCIRAGLLDEIVVHLVPDAGHLNAVNFLYQMSDWRPALRPWIIPIK